MSTKIRWTEETWNPTTGCSHVSPGCEHCYAEHLSLRFKWSAKPWKAQFAAENVKLHPDRHRHLTELKQGYEVLDELTQSLFLFDKFEDIFGPEDEDGRYVGGHYATKWTAIKGGIEFFNKMTEELVDSEAVSRDDDPFTRSLGKAYRLYEELLFEANRIDFSHQQKVFLQLLDDPDASSAICDRVKYVMVDEYQDTNYVQEQLLLRLAGSAHNICVVGDEDQSLYRFRGATVRNILQFPDHFENCPRIKLTVNYRSHRTIIDRYNRFMSAPDWTNPRGDDFRFPKEIVHDPSGEFPEYPAVCCIWGEHERDEASRFADLVVYLKQERIVEDYSQIALLLHSVRHEHSGRYIEALKRRGVPAFCPRARAYFDNPEVRDLVACFAVLLGWHGDGRNEPRGRALIELAEYVDECIRSLADKPRLEGLQQELAISEHACLSASREKVSNPVAASTMARSNRPYTCACSFVSNRN